MNWLIFDYKLSSGKKLVETYLANFGEKLSKSDRAEYEEMLLNKYGLFEVKAVKLDNWIDLESISSSRVYRVREKLGTHGVILGSLLVGRIGKQKGEWRVIGPNPIEVPLHLMKGAKKFFSTLKNLTPKDFRHLVTKIK